MTAIIRASFYYAFADKNTLDLPHNGGDGQSLLVREYEGNSAGNGLKLPQYKGWKAYCAPPATLACFTGPSPSK